MNQSTLTRVAALMLVVGLASAAVVLAVKPLKVYFQGDVAGEFIGDCGDFVVLTDYVYDGHVKIWFDADGLIYKAQRHVGYDAIYYANTNPDDYLRGGPGELENTHWDCINDCESGSEAISGMIFKVTIPGHGIVFHQAGRIVFDLETGDILVQAGPSDWSDESLGALCAALTP